MKLNVERQWIITKSTGIEMPTDESAGIEQAERCVAISHIKYNGNRHKVNGGRITEKEKNKNEILVKRTEPEEIESKTLTK